MTFVLKETGEVCCKGKATPAAITRWPGVHCVCEDERGLAGDGAQGASSTGFAVVSCSPLFPAQPPRFSGVLITSPPPFLALHPPVGIRPPHLTLAQYYRLISITATFPSSSEMRVGNGSFKKYML